MTIGTILNEIEGVLIAATEPAFNKHGANLRGILRYRQVQHIEAEHVSLSQLRDVLNAIGGKVDALCERMEARG